METPNAEKLKKYLFFVSVTFLLVTLSHLVYKYIYDDAQATPIKGGNISEGIVGLTLNLNPLLNVNDENKTITKLMYRSLLSYSPENANFENDLASCDIKNLKSIECFLKEGNKWSDGSELTIDDIFKTYTRLKEVESDTTIYPFMQDMTITINEEKIVFRSETNDINKLKILLQPIVKGDIVSAMSQRDVTGSIVSPGEMLYSGPYMLTNISSDETTGIKTVVLNRNSHFEDPSYYIEKLSFRIFDDPSHLLKYKSMINIFNDSKNILGEYSPRIQTFEYKLPKITSVFINSEKISDKDFRGFLLEKINRDDILGILGENFTKTMNPLGSLTDTSTELENKDLNSLIANYEYYSKSKIVDYLLTDEQKEIIAEEEEASLKENPELKFSINPYTRKYNFIQKDNILLSAKVDEGTQAVYMNEYKLTGFKTGDNKFFYRLEEDSYETIEQGINNYKLFFEDAEGKKKLKEEFVVAYNPDAKVLESYKQQLLAIGDGQVYSNEAKAKSLSQEEQELKDKLDALDDNFFYNRDLEKYSLSLAYITGNINIEKTAQVIQNTFETFGISVELQAITSASLSEDLAAGENNYDLILAGVNLGYFSYDIFPYFHSSQAKSGYNLSNFKKSSLDESLELMRTSNLSEEEEKKQRDNIIEILQEEQVVKSIYQPTERLLVDKNINNFQFWDYLPNYSERVNYVRDIFTLEEKEPQYTSKSVSGFIGYLLTKLF